MLQVCRPSSIFGLFLEFLPYLLAVSLNLHQLEINYHPLHLSIQIPNDAPVFISIQGNKVKSCKKKSSAREDQRVWYQMATESLTQLWSVITREGAPIIMLNGLCSFDELFKGLWSIVEQFRTVPSINFCHH